MDNPPSCTERPAGWSDFADRHARLDAPLLPTVGDGPPLPGMTPRCFCWA
jgi:hypothetical protein